MMTVYYIMIVYYFITKCDKSLLQNVSGFLLQNATVLLQNATIYYKMWRLLQIAAVQCRSILIEKSQRGSGEKKAILENNLWPHL